MSPQLSTASMLGEVKFNRLIILVFPGSSTRLLENEELLYLDE